MTNKCQVKILLKFSKSQNNNFDHFIPMFYTCFIKLYVPHRYVLTVIILVLRS